MLLTIGTAGPLNVGKSTLFSALIRTTTLAVSHPFTTIEPSTGVVPLSDTRLDKLAELFHLAEVVPTTASFVDTVGIMHGASQGESLDNQFLANTREADVICLVTRAFADPDVVHVEGHVDPKDDIKTVATELVLADVQMLEKQILRLTKEVTGKKTSKEVLETAEATLELLEQGEVLSAHGTDLDPAILCGFGLMTMKRFTYIFNIDDAGLTDEVMQVELCDFVAPAGAIFLDVKSEAEFVGLEPEEACGMPGASEQGETGLDKLARVGFDTLDLQTYPTAGGKEARVWTTHKGQTAPQATSVIHTDFERGFIKAEIVSYDDLAKYGSLAEARAHGCARMEGKDYVMADGDVMEFCTGLTSKK